MRAKLREKAGKLAVNRCSSRDEAVLNEGGSRSESVLFDFSNDGGAAGIYRFGRKLPAGAIVTNIFSDELSNLTSAGATLQFFADSTDLTDAEIYTDYAGLEERALASGADAIKISEASELNMEIAGGSITAGKLRVYFKYLLPND